MQHSTICFREQDFVFLSLEESRFISSEHFCVRKMCWSNSLVISFVPPVTLSLKLISSVVDKNGLRF